MKVHTEPKPLDEPLPGGSRGATVTVQPLSGGEVEFPAASFERPGGPFEGLKTTGLFTSRSKGWRWVPCPAFLITHPAAGSILVDTSLHSSIAAEPRENFGRLAARVARPRIESGKDLPSQLRERGADPRSIPLVVMTHMHMDHASGISEFPGSAFVLSSAEWTAATGGSRPLLRGYRPQHYDFAFDYRLVDFDGPTVDSYSTFARTFDLLGDGSIRLAFTPGHTVGHMCVLARLEDRDFVIAGDAVYTMRQLEGGPGQPRPQDPHLWRRSLQELQLFHREYPRAVIVPGHDAEHWATLDAKYE
ncbi:MAG: N-acyl homoserine lactonase family protein [Solirubrobacterales bacterium]|jgi:glyoxylase-like metal-dependent hydrolase (beta-lactamase superfamily II)